MALTDEQIESIKTKIETDKIRPIEAIKELFPQENIGDVRNQLFQKHSRHSLVSNLRTPTTKTKAEKLENIDNRIANLDQKKAKLLEEKAKLESED